MHFECITCNTCIKHDVCTQIWPRIRGWAQAKSSTLEIYIFHFTISFDCRFQSYSTYTLYNHNIPSIFFSCQFGRKNWAKKSRAYNFDFNMNQCRLELKCNFIIELPQPVSKLSLYHSDIWGTWYRILLFNVYWFWSSWPQIFWTKQMYRRRTTT